MMGKIIGYRTELDAEYIAALKAVNDAASFGKFLIEWHDWLDEETKNLSMSDWEKLQPMLKECRKKKWPKLTAQHQTAMALLAPKKLLEVSLVARACGVPWGCAYIRMHEAGAKAHPGKLMEEI